MFWVMQYPMYMPWTWESLICNSASVLWPMVSLTVFKKQRMDLSNYRYVPFAHLLAELADRLRNQHQVPRDRRLPTFYAIQILDEHLQQDFKKYFDIPVINTD